MLAAGCGEHAAPRSTTPPRSRPPAPIAAAADADPPARVEEDAALEIDATLVIGPPARLDVTLSLRTDWIPREPTEVRLTFVDELPFADGSTGFGAFVRAVDPSGALVPWPEAIPVRDGAITVRYQVELRHADAGPSRGIDEVPHRTAGGWVLAGRAFVPRSVVLGDGRRMDVPARLRLRAPEGWAQISSVDTERAEIIRAASFVSLADAMYVTGRFDVREVRQDEASVRVVTSDWDASALLSMSDLVQRTLEEGRARLGPLPPSEILVIVDRNPEGIDGGVCGNAVSILTEMPPSAAASADGGVVTVHELMHVWNRAGAWWLNEGFTRWFELWFKMRLDRASESDALDELMVIYARYLAEAEGRTIEASQGSWGYAAGAILAFCVDVRLRESGTDLFAIHRTARDATAPGTRNTITGAALLGSIESVSPETAVFARELLAQRGPIDFRRCLRPAGYVLRDSHYRGLNDRALASEVLRVSRHSHYSTTIFAAPEPSLLRAGDVITHVGRQSVRSMRDVDWMISRMRPGTRIRLSLLRDGASVDLAFPMPALTRGSRERRRRFVAQPIGPAPRPHSPFYELDAP